MDTITQLSTRTFHDNIQSLAEILTDAVDDGASVGFLAPLHPSAAAEWWHAQAGAVARGDLVIWVSHGSNGISGTVSLAFVPKASARHRAQVTKLLVHRDSRGAGIGRQLLATAEREAARHGITLLLLDTQTASDAERLYCATGWTRYGVVPGYAADPTGSLQDESFFYKRLTATATGQPGAEPILPSGR